MAAFCLLSLCCTSAWTAEGPTKTDSPVGKHVRLLAVGNSFSGNASRYLGDLVKASGGNRLTFGHASIGGCSLEKHVRLAEAFDKDPKDPTGRPYSNNTESLRSLLQKEKWDYVTIQQASMKSTDLKTYRPWAKRLYDYIKRYAPHAEVLIHETWAYREDDALFRAADFSADIMHQRLCEAYGAIAAELRCRVIPVGDAFHAARMAGWGHSAKAVVDPNAWQFPELPEQGRTLHAGWRWKTCNGTHALSNDTHHAGVAGEYLGGCVWFEFLFQQTVVGNSFVPRGLSREDARCLQNVAHQVVARGFQSEKPAAADKSEKGGVHNRR